jgi:hypothetical protein
MVTLALVAEFSVLLVAMRNLGQSPTLTRLQKMSKATTSLMAGPDPAVLEQQRLLQFAVQLAQLVEVLLIMVMDLAMSSLLLLLMKESLLLLLPVCNISRLVWVL